MDLCQANKDSVKKLYKFSVWQIKYINNQVFPKLKHMILLLTLVKIKFRIHQFIRNHYKLKYKQLLLKEEE